MKLTSVLKSVILASQIGLAGVSFGDHHQGGQQGQAGQACQDDKSSLQIYDVNSHSKYGQLCEDARGDRQRRIDPATFRCEESLEKWELKDENCFPIKRPGVIYYRIGIKTDIPDRAQVSCDESVPFRLKDAQGRCPVYERFATTINSTITYSCDDYFKGKDPAVLCKRALKTQRELCEASSPKSQQQSQQAQSAWKWEKTGEVVDCGRGKRCPTRKCVQQKPCQKPTQTPCQEPAPTQEPCQEPAPTQEPCQQNQGQQAPTPDDSTPSTPAPTAPADNHEGSSTSSSSNQHGNSGVSSSDVGAELRLTTHTHGVLYTTSSVLRVSSRPTPGSILERAGVEEGDLIYQVARRRTRSISSFMKKIKKAESKRIKKGDSYEIDVYRESTSGKRRRTSLLVRG